MFSFSDPVEQEIWSTVRSLNDAWTQGKPDDLCAFFHPRMIAITPTDHGRLDGGAACVAGWKNFCSLAHIHSWEEIDPVIQVYGESAVVAYDFRIRFDMGGKTISSEGRDMFFFVKENGRWQAVADQFSPYPT